jgi:hypothetical protein
MLCEDELADGEQIDLSSPVGDVEVQTDADAALGAQTAVWTPIGVPDWISRVARTALATATPRGLFPLNEGYNTGQTLAAVWESLGRIATLNGGWSWDTDAPTPGDVALKLNGSTAYADLGDHYDPGGSTKTSYVESRHRDRSRLDRRDRDQPEGIGEGDAGAISQKTPCR